MEQSAHRSHGSRLLFCTKKYAELFVQEFTVPHLLNSPFDLSMVVKFMPV